MKKLYIPALFTALLIEGAYIGIRWFHTGHPPIFGTFEAGLSASWTLILFSLLIDRKARFAGFIIPFAALTLVYGLLFDRTEKPLVISEESWWVWFHALFAWLAYGFYTFSFAGAVAMVYGRGEPPCSPSPNGQTQGSAPTIEEFTFQTLLWGFLAQTVMFALGSYYSIRLHGSWWVWDPVEYLFAVSWFLYAIPVHGRLFYNWGEKSIAWLIILGMLGTIILYWSLIYFPWSTYHIFDTEFKTHF